VIGSLSAYDLLAMRFQHTDTRPPDMSEDISYQAIRTLIDDHNAIMRGMLDDLAGFTTGREQGPQAMKSDDAAALRVISDQLEERGDDAGAAYLRDVAGRLEATAKPRFVDWPEGLGVGDLKIDRVEIIDKYPNFDRFRYDYQGLHEPPHRYRFLILVDPVGAWTTTGAGKPRVRVIQHENEGTSTRLTVFGKPDEPGS
jgi:hypothetical protein